MAINLQIENLTKSFGERVLFENITLGINDQDRIGLIAANGTGKTTLLNIIAGREEYQSGAIVPRKELRIGYLEQNPTFPEGITVLQAAFHSDNPVVEIIARYEQALITEDTTALETLISEMDQASAWDYEQRAKQILTELKITDLDQRVEQLSGGQLKRIALANALITQPELLILDEPTNHLDLEMIEWLESFLAQGRMSLLMVTHDRYFLDRVCNQIVEIDDQQLYTYRGNYSYFIEKRQERIDLTNTMAQKSKNLYKRELDWIRRTPSARTGKAKYRIDAFEELSTQRRTAIRTQEVRLGIKSSYIGGMIFEMTKLSKSYGTKTILSDFSYTFAKGEKLGIVGDNGVGKSTFIKMLLGEVQPDGGEITVGETVKFGYYSQSGLEFDEKMKVIDVVKAISEDILMADGSRLTASQFLQQFLFPPSVQHNFVYKLSGGERRRLYLCTVLIGNPNFLILDEPTNDLDIQTLSVLEEYLAGYGGCVIVVSHDRYFMDKVVDHIFAMEGQGVVKDYPGGYSDYREWRLAEDQTKAESVAQSKRAEELPTEKVAKPQEVKRKLSFGERREFETIERELPELEALRDQIEQSMSSGTLSAEELQKQAGEISRVIREIDAKTMRWLELSEYA